MEKNAATWSVFGIYLLIIALMLLSGITFGQVKVIYFNAEWNKSNEVEWIQDLKDVKEIKESIEKIEDKLYE